MIGNEKMGDTPHLARSLGFQAWKKSVEYHRNHNRLITLKGNRGLLIVRLSVPNDEEYTSIARG